MGDDRCDLPCLDLPEAEALSAARMTEPAASVLAARAKALADPTRLTLAAALAQAGELCVCDLARVAERSEDLASHHLRALRRRGVAERKRAGKIVMYSITG